MKRCILVRSMRPVLRARNASLEALGKGGLTLQAMLSRIRKLTTRVWIAAITFAIGVVLTMVWVVPFDRMKKTPDQGAASNLPQQTRNRIS
jgi:hypothetical protein